MVTAAIPILLFSVIFVLAHRVPMEPSANWIIGRANVNLVGIMVCGDLRLSSSPTLIFSRDM